MDEIIVVRQLPIIEEQLKQISGQIQGRVQEALSLACTEETVKEVKAVRAALNRDFTGLEERRKEVKKKVLSPYEQFEAVYKSYVTDVFKPADAKLKEKISQVENGLKEQKREEIAAYFEEYRQSKGIDFVSFPQSGIEITLSASKKGLKDKAKEFLDRIGEDLELISSEENAAEILVEYKRTLNAAQAITTVRRRREEVEAQRRRVEAAKELERQRREAEKKVEEAIRQEVLASPTVSQAPDEGGLEQGRDPLTQEAAKAAPEKKYRLTFTVVGTLEELRALKAFLTEGGYQYES